MLSASAWNPRFEEGLETYRQIFKARLKDIYKDGHFIGQEPYRNHLEEAQALAPHVGTLMQIVLIPFNPEDPITEQRKRRAQHMLQRYATLIGENGAEPTPTPEEAT